MWRQRARASARSGSGDRTHPRSCGRCRPARRQRRPAGGRHQRAHLLVLGRHGRHLGGGRGRHGGQVLQHLAVWEGGGGGGGPARGARERAKGGASSSGMLGPAQTVEAAPCVARARPARAAGRPPRPPTCVRILSRLSRVLAFFMLDTGGGRGGGGAAAAGARAVSGGGRPRPRALPRQPWGPACTPLHGGASLLPPTRDPQPVRVHEVVVVGVTGLRQPAGGGGAQGTAAAGGQE